MSAATPSAPARRELAVASGRALALELALAGRPQAEVLDALARAAQAVCGDEAFATVLLLDAEARVLRHGAAPALPEDFSRAIDGLPVGPMSGVCGSAAHSLSTVIVPDVESDPRCTAFIGLAQRHGLRSCWSMPVVSDTGSLLGTFAVYRRLVHTPDAAEREGLAQLARTAALVLERGRETQRREQAERQLRASEERYRSLFDSVDEGWCIVEMMFDDSGRAVDYRFLETNPAFVKHSGLVDAVGRTIRELVPGIEPHWFEVYGRVATSGEPVRFVHEAASLGRWYDVYAMRMGDPGRYRVAMLFKDISAHKRSEDELRRLADQLSDADRRKDEFMATLAHELRNPLAPLRNGLQIMRMAADNPAAVAKARDMMARQLDSMVRLVNDLLDVARIGSGKLEIRKERVTLQAIVSSAVETSLPAIEAGRHELDVELGDAGALQLEVDPTRLAQAVSNLLHNAAKYTPSGGRIRVRANATRDEVAIVVSDNGVGIAAEAVGSLFNMFAQVGRDADRSQGGLGIGLALVRRLLELHGGTVEVSSAGVGQGSSFSLRLPLPSAAPDAAAPGMPASAPGAAARAAALRVLIADDNRDAAESLALALQIAGHVTAVVHDGLEALRRAPAFAPDAAVLDIGMPGLDGFEVARSLRSAEATRAVTLVALTGRGAPADRATAQEAGFDDYLTKPSAPEEVEAALLQGVRSRREAAHRPM